MKHPLRALLIAASAAVILAAAFSGCAKTNNAFRNEFKSVAVTGSYGSPDGQTVGAGVKLGIRKPDPSK